MTSRFLLDTSVLIDLLRHKGPAESFIFQHIEDYICTSTICEAELNEGIYREKPENIPKRLSEKQDLFASFSESIPFDSQQADIAGRIRAELSKKGSLIGDLDILIGAAAVFQSTVLVTKNPAHFSRISALQICPL
jgi:tRNA(fMet)-specific endonuclease VapC